jgi:hypothetical protein
MYGKRKTRKIWAEKSEEETFTDLRTGGTLIKNIAFVYIGCNWLQTGIMGQVWEHSNKHLKDLTSRTTLLVNDSSPCSYFFILSQLLLSILLLLVQLLKRVRERSGESASIRVSSTSAVSTECAAQSHHGDSSHTHTQTHVVITVPSYPPPLHYEYVISSNNA